MMLSESALYNEANPDMTGTEKMRLADVSEEVIVLSFSVVVGMILNASVAALLCVDFASYREYLTIKT